MKTLQKVSVECSNDMIEFLSSNCFCGQERVNPGGMNRAKILTTYENPFCYWVKETLSRVFLNKSRIKKVNNFLIFISVVSAMYFCLPCVTFVSNMLSNWFCNRAGNLHLVNIPYRM